jgi:hypothetical protein
MNHSWFMAGATSCATGSTVVDAMVAFAVTLRVGGDSVACMSSLVRRVG